MISTLIPREREVAELAALGTTNRETSKALGIAPSTVKTHIANIYDKLGIGSRAELARAMVSGEDSQGD